MSLNKLLLAVYLFGYLVAQVVFWKDLGPPTGDSPIGYGVVFLLVQLESAIWPAWAAIYGFGYIVKLVVGVIS